jgi:hypothetical protein
MALAPKFLLHWRGSVPGFKKSQPATALVMRSKAFSYSLTDCCRFFMVVRIRSRMTCPIFCFASSAGEGVGVAGAAGGAGVAAGAGAMTDAEADTPEAAGGVVPPEAGGELAAGAEFVGAAGAVTFAETIAVPAGGAVAVAVGGVVDETVAVAVGDWVPVGGGVPEFVAPPAGPGPGVFWMALAKAVSMFPDKSL